MTDPTPSRRSWFAVWRWPRWTWGLAIVLAFFGYALSPMPVFKALVETRNPAAVRTMADTVYYPLMWCWANFEFIRKIYTWEGQVIDRVVGVPSTIIVQPATRKIFIRTRRGIMMVI